ncbi:MAG: hypothetical protein KDD43_15755, partial [Bdellovibrionales bacterium]|nr:hypothetical protein [Bdellovibrionales bacterium]
GKGWVSKINGLSELSGTKEGRVWQNFHCQLVQFIRHCRTMFDLHQPLRSLVLLASRVLGINI